MSDHDDGLLAAGFGDPDLAVLLSWPTRVRRMIEVEAALGGGLADAGLISAEEASAIRAACAALVLDQVTLERLAAAAAMSATPVIPLVDALTAGRSATWLHHGATSQDIIDTAVVLQLRDALRLIEQRVVTMTERCADLAERHRATLMPGRTLLQQAVPITFGLKAARWLGMLDRRLEQLRLLPERVLVLQYGGSAGTGAVHGAAADVVATAMGSELGLPVPDLPWHAERDRIAELAATLDVLASSAHSIASELALLASTEIAEVRFRAVGGPTSSAMPHKQNAVDAMAARAACRLARADLGALLDAAGSHAGERAVGEWQVEWVALPSALVRLGGGLRRLAAALDLVEPDVLRARANLDLDGGRVLSESLSAALVAHLGRPAAQALVGRLAKDPRSESVALLDLAAADPEVSAVLSEEELGALREHASTLANSATMVDRALAAHRRLITS